MYKFLSVILILGVAGCERVSDKNISKPPFIEIEDCIKYVNKSDAKKGYPKRKKDSVIYECKNSLTLMESS
jgi:hypothetical protein